MSRICAFAHMYTRVCECILIHTCQCDGAQSQANKPLSESESESESDVRCVTMVQGLNDAYGVPRYQELNPGIFYVVTYSVSCYDVRAHTHTYMHAYMRQCLSLYTCIVYIYIYIHIHTHIHTCKHTCMHAYVHTYMRSPHVFNAYFGTLVTWRVNS
jgi:hypothetical protein